MTEIEQKQLILIALSSYHPNAEYTVDEWLRVKEAVRNHKDLKKAYLKVMK